MIILVFFALNIHHFWGITLGHNLGESAGGDLVEVGPITRADWWDRATGVKSVGSVWGAIFLDLFGVENCPPLVGGCRDFVGFFPERALLFFVRVFCLFWPYKDLDLWQASWPHKSNQNTLSGLTFCRGFWSSLLHSIASGLSCISDFLNQFPLQKDTRRVAMQTWQHVILGDDNFCSFLVWVGYSVQKGSHISCQWKIVPLEYHTKYIQICNLKRKGVNCVSIWYTTMGPPAISTAWRTAWLTGQWQPGENGWWIGWEVLHGFLEL